jgi:SPOR domain
MRLSFAATALIGVALGLVACSTAALAQLSGPANLPPSSYQGMQFVDSRGCLFLRAGFGAQTVWVPMVDDGKNQMCGMAPSFGGAVAAVAPAPLAKPVAPSVAPLVVAPAPVVKPASMVVAAATVAPLAMAPVAMAPVLAPPVAPAVIGYQSVALGGATASCGPRSPVLERVVLRNGGTALVCTQGDGTLTGWSNPLFGAGAGVGAALGYQTATAQNLRGARMAGPVTAGVAARAPAVNVASSMPAPPKGWKYAWKDDRLNPMRGVGTAQGQAQMDALWTRQVPAKLVTTPVAAPLVFAAPPVAPVARVSTMSAPNKIAAKAAPAKAASGALYVQVGSFGVAANAAGAAARIAALGLPSASGHLAKGGSALQVVYAGPFADAGSAQSALAALKSAGFRDAFVR